MKTYISIILLIFVIYFVGCGEESVKAENGVSRVYHVNIDSDPKEADIYWYVLSRSDEVSSSNRFHMGKTPLEATQSLRIVRLTKSNAVDVDVVIEVDKRSCNACSAKRFYMNAKSLLNSRGISLFANLKEN